MPSRCLRRHAYSVAGRKVCRISDAWLDVATVLQKQGCGRRKETILKVTN